MKHNYNYAKLIDGKLEYAPNKLIIGEEQIFNAPAEIYSKKGYVPVVKSEIPESDDNFHYSPVYTEKRQCNRSRMGTSRNPK